MTDNSTDLSTKLEHQEHQPEAVPVAADTTSTVATPLVATPPVVTPDVVDSAPDTTARIATSNVTPPVQEVPQRDTVIDPRVIALRAMFPDYDDIILISVLESVGGSQDRAIDALLVMGDPEYKGEPPAAAQSEQPPLSQTELDEQFARHLMIEEQQQQQWVNANQRPPVAYESQPSQRSWNSQPQPDAGENQMGDFHEQFNKIAESGKKTIGNLFSKVKAKFQEFDQDRSTGQTSTQPLRDVNTNPYDIQGQVQHAAVTQPSYFDPNSRSSFSSTQPLRDVNTNPYDTQGQVQHAAVTQPSYFDPNSHSSFSTPLIAHQSSPAPAPVLKGYDLSRSHSITPPDTPEILPASPATNSSLPRSSIEAGKLGLLPKRPVSLLRDPAATGSNSSPAASLPPQPTRQPPEDDDDDILEYTENPFEETKK